MALPPQEKDVYQSIKSGDFYSRGLVWYNLMYVYPVIERTFLITLTLICVAINLLAIYAVLTFFPLTQKIPLVVNINDLGEEYSEIKKLEEANVEPMVSVMKYMAGEYVESRESYSYSDIDRNLNFIRQFSTPELAQAYSNYLDLRNAASPTNRLRQTGSIAVRIVSVEFTPDSLPSPEKHDNLRKASVIFQTTERASGQVPITNSYKADLVFTFSDIVYNKAEKNFSPLDFMVKEYTVTQLNQPNNQQIPSQP